jgi:hypothetical protein
MRQPPQALGASPEQKPEALVDVRAGVLEIEIRRTASEPQRSFRVCPLRCRVVRRPAPVQQRREKRALLRRNQQVDGERRAGRLGMGDDLQRLAIDDERALCAGGRDQQ